MIKEITTGVKTLLTLATWGRVLPSVFLMVACAAFWVVYKNPDLSNYIPSPKMSTTAKELKFIGPETQRNINDVVKQDRLIDIIYVMGINTDNMTKTVIYRSIDESNVAVKKIIDSQDLTIPRTYRFPFWGPDVVSIKQMKFVLNAEFKCGPATESGLFEAYPGLVDRIKTTCRMAIPPIRNEVAGYLIFHLAIKEPNDYQVDQLSLIAYELSQKIAKNELGNRQTYQKLAE